MHILVKADYSAEQWKAIKVAYTFWCLQGKKNDPAKQESGYRYHKAQVAAMLEIPLEHAHELIIQWRAVERASEEG